MKLLALLLPPLLLFAPDPVRTYKKELSKVSSHLKQYEAKVLDQDLRDAYEVYRSPWSQRGQPDAPKNISYDFSGYAEVYERWAGYEQVKVELALGLAEVNDQKVAERLVETLLDVLTEIQKLDEAVLTGRPMTRRIHDLVPGMKRHGCWIHRDGLVAALGKLTEQKAVDYLHKKGWSKAEKWDKKKKSVRARVALLDALALTGKQVTVFRDEAKRHDEPGIRIAMLEALARGDPGPPTNKLLREVRDDDPCRAVREAARSLLGEKSPAPPEDAPRFCGIPVASKKIVLVLDTSWSTIKPVEVELMKTRTWREWRSVAEKDREWITQADYLIEDARALVNALPTDGRFNLVQLGQGEGPRPLVERGTIPADAKGKRRASAFLDEILPGGWESQVSGLWMAWSLSGPAPYGMDVPEDPAADTILLATDGVPCGGPLLYAPAIIDEVRRRYRIDRIRIHTVRIDDAEGPAEEILKGIAEATGGTYLHLTKP